MSCQRPPLKDLTLKSQPESETTPDKSDITDKADQSRVLLKAIPSTEEAEQAEKTDQESKVEEEENVGNVHDELNRDKYEKPT